MNDWSNPLAWLHQFELSHPVVSCESAATAKKISLEHELKSLVLDTDRGLVVAHLRGDQRLSLRSVKRELAVDEARLATLPDLLTLEASPGEVCPFAPSIWKLTQVVASRVLPLNWVSTNAESSTKYIVFDPLLLLRAQFVVVANIEEGVR
jgi:prolyl-tRNA editing enzyme YbaK/EbsC (Cys-tRNA(Pro) deacylase)